MSQNAKSKGRFHNPKVGGSIPPPPLPILLQQFRRLRGMQRRSICPVQRFAAQRWDRLLLSLSKLFNRPLHRLNDRMSVTPCRISLRRLPNVLEVQNFSASFRLRASGTGPYVSSTLEVMA